MKRRFRHGAIGVAIGFRVNHQSGSVIPAPTVPWYVFSNKDNAWQVITISGF